MTKKEIKDLIDDSIEKSQNNIHKNKKLIEYIDDAIKKAFINYNKYIWLKRSNWENDLKK
jgi:hypothetical protein